MVFRLGMFFNIHVNVVIRIGITDQRKKDRRRPVLEILCPTNTLSWKDFSQIYAGPDSPSPCSSSLSADSSSELVLVDVLCELVEVVLVDGPCELVVDRICPPVVSRLAPDWRGSTGTGGWCLKKFGHSRDFVVPQLLTHRRQRKVHVQVLVLGIWTFLVFRSYQSLHQVLQTALG